MSNDDNNDNKIVPTLINRMISTVDRALFHFDDNNNDNNNNNTNLINNSAENENFRDKWYEAMDEIAYLSNECHTLRRHILNINQKKNFIKSNNNNSNNINLLSREELVNNVLVNVIIEEKLREQAEKFREHDEIQSSHILGLENKLHQMNVELDRYQLLSNGKTQNINDNNTNNNDNNELNEQLKREKDFSITLQNELKQQQKKNNNEINELKEKLSNTNTSIINYEKEISQLKNALLHRQREKDTLEEQIQSKDEHISRLQFHVTLLQEYISGESKDQSNATRASLTPEDIKRIIGRDEIRNLRQEIVSYKQRYADLHAAMTKQQKRHEEQSERLTTMYNRVKNDYIHERKEIENLKEKLAQKKESEFGLMASQTELSTKLSFKEEELRLIKYDRDQLHLQVLHLKGNGIPSSRELEQSHEKINTLLDQVSQFASEVETKVEELEAYKLKYRALHERISSSGSGSFSLPIDLNTSQIIHYNIINNNNNNETIDHSCQTDEDLYVQEALKKQVEALSAHNQMLQDHITSKSRRRSSSSKKEIEELRMECITLRDQISTQEIQIKQLDELKLVLKSNIQEMNDLKLKMSRIPEQDKILEQYHKENQLLRTQILELQNKSKSYLSMLKELDTHMRKMNDDNDQSESIKQLLQNVDDEMDEMEAEEANARILMQKQLKMVSSKLSSPNLHALNNYHIRTMSTQVLPKQLEKYLLPSSQSTDEI